MKNDMLREAAQHTQQAIALRRALHEQPELSFRETRTAARIADALDEAGIAWRAVAGTGILARIDGTAVHGATCHSGASGGGAGIRDCGKSSSATAPLPRAVVLRADIDALPVQEATGLPYASKAEGVMHACGHDLHAGMLLGALRTLHGLRETFAGSVFGLFQPGEEQNPGGASRVLAEGPFAGWEVLAVVGQHVEPQMPTGRFGVRAGKYMASNDELRFRIRGAGGHAALREQIVDPVEAAAALITALYALPGENTAPELPTILSIGKVAADGATNVVPDEVYLEGTMRTFDERWRERLCERINQVCNDIEVRYGVSVVPDIDRGYPCVVNDEALVVQMRTAAQALFGADAVEALPLRPTAEDFGFYCRQYPSVFYRIGVGGTAAEMQAGQAGRLHTPGFCPDEGAMAGGIALLASLAVQVLGATR